MVKVKPFRGFLVNKELAPKIIARPYDVIERDEAREVAAGVPMSFYHINKPEIDLPDEIHDSSEIYS